VSDEKANVCELSRVIDTVAGMMVTAFGLRLVVSRP
jgi:hypothetical protein